MSVVPGIKTRQRQEKCDMGLRRLALVPFVLALGLVLAPPAWADTYTEQVADKFQAQTHVVADPAAKPPLDHSEAVNQQLLASSWTWSSRPPIWVAAVAPDQTGGTTQ